MPFGQLHVHSLSYPALQTVWVKRLLLAHITCRSDYYWTASPLWGLPTVEIVRMRSACSMFVLGAADLGEGKENSPVPAAAAESGVFGAMAGICSPQTPGGRVWNACSFQHACRVHVAIHESDKSVPCAEGMVNASRIHTKVAPGKGGVLAASRSRLGQVIQLQTAPAAVGGRTSGAQASLQAAIVDCT